MRIAFAMINTNRRDGHSRPIAEVAERLSNRGHDVHLYARTVEDIDLNLVKWHYIPGIKDPEVADFWTFLKIANFAIARQKYDIVHSVGPNTLHANVISIQNIQPAKARVLGPLGTKEKISQLRRLSRAIYTRVTSQAEKKLFEGKNKRRKLCFLPVSVGVEHELREHYNIGDSIVRVIPNAADTNIFFPRNPDERELWRKENGIRSDSILAIFTGGEWTRKGLELAIRSIPMIESPRFHLFVAGDDPDRSRYIEIAKECGVTSRVTFGGFRSDIAIAMSSSDLFLFPSYYEAFSLATIEAAACGLPVIAAKINGTEDFIQPGVTGEFVPHESEGIGSVLNRLLADPSRMRQMGENARKLVWRDYTWDRVADMTEQAYLDTVAANTSN